MSLSFHALLLLDALAIFGLCGYGYRYLLHRKNAKRRAALSISPEALVLGLFHPYCNAGGGGERVLWTAIACLQAEEPDVICAVYSGDIDATKEQILERANDRFSIRIDPQRIVFVFTKRRRWIEDRSWPRFTMLGQSLGSMLLTWEAMHSLVPDLFIDTMGYAFSYPIVKALAGIPVGCYIHYPTISPDMLQRVRKRTAGHTNASAVSSSVILSYGKMIYYQLFKMLYTSCLSLSDNLMTNSTWTHRHIETLLDTEKPISRIVYPPCEVDSLTTLDLNRRKRLILSVAQFRPEKEHAVQIKAMAALAEKAEKYRSAELVLAGSVRNAGDEARVASLRQLARDLGIEHSIRFVINAPYSELLEWFGTASMGISTMVDEHFGISVVELMAAGLIPVVHPSAGPLLDIVVPFEGHPTGYHASSPEQFADRIAQILDMSEAEALVWRKRARDSVLERFSVPAFEKLWLSAYRDLKSKL